MENRIEIWKPVVGYEGLYEVSNLGRVKSLGKGKTWKTERIKKAKIGSNGYNSLTLWKNGKENGFLVHRLVAEAFIPNPNNLPQVNHKDENKQNNCAENLEWCTCEYNLNYGTHNERMKKHHYSPMLGKFGKLHPNSKPIYQFSLEGNLIKMFESTREVERELGYRNSNISSCARGKYKTAYGYVWRYKEEKVA